MAKKAKAAAPKGKAPAMKIKKGDDVADAGVAPTGAAEHADAQDLLGSGVVGDLQPRLLLDHLSLFLAFFSL